MSTYSDLIGGSAGSATTVYAALADLPLSDVVAGAQAYVSATNRLYLWSGAGWYNIALINTAPTITTGGDSSYALASDGTATVVTLDANDPEGIPITWSYAVTTGALGSTATVSQNNNVFTITPSTASGDAGSFTLTFTASDGVNLATSASEFTLAFDVIGRAIFYNDAAQADQVQTGSGANPEWYFGKATRHIWTVPLGVTSVHAICVGAGGGSTNSGGGGGGALRWANNIPVTPGAQYEVLVGSPGGTHYGNPNYIGGSSELSLVGGANVLFAGGGGAASGGSPWPRNNGGLGGTGSNAAGLTAGGGSGGNGGGANGSNPGMGTDGMHGGGGGAGGYTAAGGEGGDFWDSNPNPTAGTGGGGGGGAAGNASGSGGGVGIYGQGDNGTAGTHPGSGTVWGTPGGGGSGGADGVGSNNTAQGFGGGDYGGGAGYSNRPGGNGVVTIIWGLNRAYPSTDVGLSGAALLMQAQADLSVSDLSELSAPITLVGNATGSNSQQLFSSPTIAFDGSGDRVTATKVPNLGADFTVEAWVYANAGLGNAVIVGSIDNVGNWGSNGYWALMRGAGGANYGFQIDDAGYTSTSTAPATGVWQHIAVTRSSGTVRYFIDGVLNSTSYTNTRALTNPSGIVVGSGPNNNYIYDWNGHIQDVRISAGVALYTESFTPPTALLQG